MLEVISKLTLEHWFTVIGLIISFTWGAAILLFGRISIKHIEREMAKEGLEPPVWDKGIGGRLMMYAIVIVTNKVSEHSLVNDSAILRHTRTKDYSLAVFLLISSVFFFTLMGIAYYLYAPAN